MKIGQFGWKESQARPDIPEEFETLEPQFFSLGQDDSYYENLKKRRKAIREAVLEHCGTSRLTKSCMLRRSTSP